MNRSRLVFATVLVLSLSLAGCGSGSSSGSANESRARAIAVQLAAGDFQSCVKDFDETMKTSLPADALGQAWAKLLGQAGAFKKVSSVRSEKSGTNEAVFVKCEFEKGAIELKLVFDGAGRVAGLFFLPASAASAKYDPPAYVDTDSFFEEEVVVGKGEWKLPATVSIPRGKGPFPAVVLVHGSGPNDRDEAVGPLKPFKDLAWGLASSGVVVLRYEKRTREYQSRMAESASRVTVKEEVTDDAAAAVALVRGLEGVDRDRVFLLGHSLGGMLVPRIAMLDPQVHGFIIMAGPTRPLEDLLIEQTEYISSLDGTLSDEEKKSLEMMRASVAKVKDPSLSPETPTSELPLGMPGAYWLDLRGYSPAEVAKRISKPVLIIQGERDYQVTMADFKGWQDAVSNKKNFAFKSYPALNHLFIEGAGKATPAEYQVEGHVAPYVITDIAAFVKSN